MGQRKKRSSKRRRVVEPSLSLIEGAADLSATGASSSSTAGTSSSSTTASSSLLTAGGVFSSLTAASTTSANAPSAQLKEYAVMTPGALQTLLLEKDEHLPFLIVDVREPHCFEESKIICAHCVTANVESTGGNSSSSDVITFKSRREVIRTLGNRCPELLPHLCQPGHYSHIVIFDEKSTAAECSKSIQFVYNALIKWNESTRTSISVLEGGITRFSQEFPNSVVTSNETGAPEIQAHETPTLSDILENTGYSADQKKETVEELLISVKYIDKKMAFLQKMMTLQAKIAALETLELGLYGELADGGDKLIQILKTSFPEAGSCPIDQVQGSK